jgi:outer membrane protein assembly factor BamB
VPAEIVTSGAYVYASVGFEGLLAFLASGCGQPECEPIWTGPSVFTLVPNLVATGGVVYARPPTGGVAAFDGRTGAQLWTSTIVGTFSVTNGAVYVDATDKLSSLSTADGTIIWTKTASGALGIPTAAGGVLYVPNSDGTLRAYDTADGSLLWTSASANYTSAAISDGRVFACSSQIIAFGL